MSVFAVSLVMGSLALARAWVEQHADALSRTDAELLQQPLMNRKALYAASPPEVKAAFWKAHLEQHQREPPVLRARGAAAFSRQELGAVIAQPGPPEDASLVGIQCRCSVVSSYCAAPFYCGESQCDLTNGCGDLWMFKCNGLCFNI